MKRTRSAPGIVWFRHDLRLADNPALSAAAELGPVVPVFIWAPAEEAPWEPGAASRWWLHFSLAALDSELRRRSAKLLLRHGPTLETLLQLCAKTGAKTVYWNRRYEPCVRERDDRIVCELEANGIQSRSFNAALLHEPWEIKNRPGRPFQVFTPFWKHCLSLPQAPEPLPAPPHLTILNPWPESIPLADLKLTPVPDWAGGLRAAWDPGEVAALKRLHCFLETSLAAYDEQRNIPGVAGTSRLSPRLHFGEISPRQVWHALRSKAEKLGTPKPAQEWLTSQFVAELGWREFAHHLLYHFPHTVSEPLRPEFKKLRWRNRPEWLKAWQLGRTGYPIVDAGMRELWHTGWMHNRVRMIVASFLVKDLLVSWNEGARWFWDTLVDADLAQNTLGWQWTAGCGADAAPFFRIFNPTAQGEKFDPAGNYIRTWIPELAALPVQWIHSPSRAPEDLLVRAGVKLGQTYPQPLVSHAIAREVALEAYQRIRKAPQ
jgi:deoxyribodipyrimidine photo-lyase